MSLRATLKKHLRLLQKQKKMHEICNKCGSFFSKNHYKYEIQTRKVDLFTRYVRKL